MALTQDPQSLSLHQPPSHHSIYLIAVAVLGLALTAVSIFSYQTSKALEDAKSTIIILEEQLDLQSGQAGATEGKLKTTEQMASYLSDKFDELDTILLDTDSNSVDFVNWVYDNALFENVPEAQAKYEAWEREQLRTNDAYAKLTDELQQYFPQYGVQYQGNIQ